MPSTTSTGPASCTYFGTATSNPIDTMPRSFLTRIRTYPGVAGPGGILYGRPARNANGPVSLPSGCSGQTSESGGTYATRSPSWNWSSATTQV